MLLIGLEQHALGQACSGTPTALMASSSSTSTCAGQAVMLSLAGTAQMQGIIYQWEAAQNGAFFTPIQGATNAFYAANQTTTTDYRCMITCQNSGMSVYSNVITVTSNPPIMATTTATPATCEGLNDGQIVVDAIGGTGSFQYSLNGGAFQNSNVFTGLAPGNHSITVTDNNNGGGGCYATVPDTITIKWRKIKIIIIFGAATIIPPSHGSGPYTYDWVGGNAAIANNLTVGNSYPVMTTDAAGCILRDTFVYQGFNGQTVTYQGFVNNPIGNTPLMLTAGCNPSPCPLAVPTGGTTPVPPKCNGVSVDISANKHSVAVGLSNIDISANDASTTFYASHIPVNGATFHPNASLSIDNNGMDMVSMSANFSNLGLINPSLPIVKYYRNDSLIYTDTLPSLNAALGMTSDDISLQNVAYYNNQNAAGFSISMGYPRPWILPCNCTCYIYPCPCCPWSPWGPIDRMEVYAIKGGGIPQDLEDMNIFQSGANQGFLITSEATNSTTEMYACHSHTALGSAELMKQGSTLTVSNIGSSGNDGVEINLMGDKGLDMYFEPVSIPVGGKMEITPLDNLGQVTSKMVMVDSVNNVKSLSLQIPAGSIVEITGYANGQIVYFQAATRIEERFPIWMLIAAYIITHTSVHYEKTDSGSTWGVDWNNTALVSMGSGSQSVGVDYLQIKVVNLALTGPVKVNLTGQNMPPFTLIREEPKNQIHSAVTCAGNNVFSLSLSSTNTNAQYQWQKSTNGSIFSNILGATTPNITTTQSTNTWYRCLSTCASSGITTLSSALFVPFMPTPVIVPNGPTTFCANTPSILSTNMGGGYSYQWKRGNTIVSNMPNYTPSISGNHKLIVTGTNGCKDSSVWVNITVKALPIANAGADKGACVGTPVQIGISPNTANTYTWSPMAGLSNANIANPMASPATTTTYILTVNNATTGCTNSDAVIVNPLIVPNVPILNSTTSPVCQGTNITLSPFVVGASSVDWYKNGILLYNKPASLSQNITTPNSSPDIYSIKAKAMNGCLSLASNSVSVQINAAPLPTITSTPAANGNLISICVPNGTSGSASLTASSSMTATYTWKLAGVYIPNATGNTYTQVVTPTNNYKNVSVEAIYSNGCTRTSTVKVVKLLTIGCSPRLASEVAAQITLFPNPTQDIITLMTEGDLLNGAKVFVFDELGKKVYETQIPEQTLEYQIDLRTFASGIYMIQIMGKNGQFSTHKVIKE